MRQIVSLIKDDQVHYALVDEATGELIPFADIHLPDPDRFGLHEAAVLGTNLINTLGLMVNGQRPRKAVAQTPTPALPPAPVNETAKEAKLRRQREAYHRSKAQGTGKTKGGAERFISLDEVMAVVNQHPEGLTTRQIAERIWRADTGGNGTMPYWYMNSVSNRQTIAEQRRKDTGEPPPFRIEYRSKIGKNGLPTQLQEKIILPLVDGH